MGRDRNAARGGPSHDIQSYALHELARDDAMITEPGNSERPLAGPFGLRIGRADQAASAS
jgi:hypothetical protein